MKNWIVKAQAGEKLFQNGKRTLVPEVTVIGKKPIDKMYSGQSNVINVPIKRPDTKTYSGQSNPIDVIIKRPVKKEVKKVLTPEERAEGLKKAFAQKEQAIKAKTSFNNTGMKKEDVIKLQQDLIDAGFGEILGKADGKWGKNSAAALEAFQNSQANDAMSLRSGDKKLLRDGEQMGNRVEGFTFQTRGVQKLPTQPLDRNLRMKKGGIAPIHIKPENKGKFTATKKATGKSTEELTHSSDPVTKKRAVFAQNAAKWKHEVGGKVGDPIRPKYKFDPTLPNVTKKQKGGTVATADSTKYYSKQLTGNIKEFYDADVAKNTGGKEEAAKKITQTKNYLARQENKGKPGYDKNGFKTPVKQRGGTVGEGPKEGDTAAVYKKGDKLKKQTGGYVGDGGYGSAKKGGTVKKQMGGGFYGAKAGAKVPAKGKVDASKWKK